LLNRKRRLIERIAVADPVPRQRLIEKLRDKFAALARRNGSFEPPDQFLGQPHEQLLHHR
jgi:hypothetical protein